MADFLSGLEKLGFGNVSDIDVYGKEEEVKKATVQAEEKKKAESTVDESTLVFEKKMTCPCCNGEFPTLRVRTGKARALKSDSDLRPRCNNFDPVKYDVVSCPRCGYSAIFSSFDGLVSAQAKLLRDQVKAKFTGFGEFGNTYSYDEAILRCKMAILCTVVKRGKDSEKAFSCLKLAWLYRGKAEQLAESGAPESVLEQLKKEEAENLELAYEGFSEAYSKERFPIIGLPESGYQYLLAELARRIGKIDDSRRICGRLMQEKDLSRNIKDLIYDLKEKLNEIKE